jgi:hypothetical protein
MLPFLSLISAPFAINPAAIRGLKSNCVTERLKSRLGLFDLCPRRAARLCVGCTLGEYFTDLFNPVATHCGQFAISAVGSALPKDTYRSIRPQREPSY